MNAESPEQTEPGSDEQTNAAETAALDVQPEQPASGESPSRVWQPRSPRQHLMVGLGLTVLLGALYLPGLGSYGLYDPWETHYGEVARNMVENANYIDPFWGSPWDPSGVKKREREGFYSKPPLTMWMTSTGMNLLGFNEWGVRLLFPVLMILALMAIYLAVSRFFNPLAGMISVGVMATTPIISFMSRQAVTDGPMVALVTIGMMALCMGLFFVDEEEEASPRLYWATLLGFLGVALSQLWAILPMDRSPDAFLPYTGTGGAWFKFQHWLGQAWTVGWGKGTFIALLLMPFLVWAAWRIARQKRRQMLYIYIFYICCGLVVPAKVWLGWAPMGMSILAYLAISGEWKILLRVDVGTGLLVVFMTGHPWVVAMVAGHHPGWFDRFIMHDHINRLSKGVHSLDDGGFEYFFQWIGYGLFPWIGLLPAGVLAGIGRLRGRVNAYTPQQKFILMMLLWAILSFFLFSKSSTKFHHYILPAIPPLCILIGLFISDVLVKRAQHVGLFALMAALITIWVGQDLYSMPKNYGQGSQNLVNLFTYKYDREWPKHTDGEALKALEDTAIEKANKEHLKQLKSEARTARLRMKGLPRVKGQTQPSFDDEMTHFLQQLEEMNTSLEALRSQRKATAAPSPEKEFGIDWHLLSREQKLERLRTIDEHRALGLLANEDIRKVDRVPIENARLNMLAAPIQNIAWIAMIGFVLMAVRREWLREGGVAIVSYGAVWMSLYCLHTYLPDVAEDWSQKSMWDAYYADCTEFDTSTPEKEAAFKLHLLNTTSRVPNRMDLFPSGRCVEPIVAFRTNWRGETFYSANTVVPNMYVADLKPWLGTYGNDKPFYVFTETTRIKSELEKNLPTHLKGQYKKVFGEDRKFALLRVEAGINPHTKAKPVKKAPKKAAQTRVRKRAKPTANSKTRQSNQAPRKSISSPATSPSRTAPTSVTPGITPPTAPVQPPPYSRPRVPAPKPSPAVPTPSTGQR